MNNIKYISKSGINHQVKKWPQVFLLCGIWVKVNNFTQKKIIHVVFIAFDISISSHLRQYIWISNFFGSSDFGSLLANNYSRERRSKRWQELCLYLSGFWFTLENRQGYPGQWFFKKICTKNVQKNMYKRNWFFKKNWAVADTRTLFSCIVAIT